MATSKKIHSFKHYAYGKYKIDFYKQTAIIMWSNKVNDEYDEKTSYKATKTAILGRLNNSEVFDTKFILLQDIFPAEYTQLPPEKEVMELYVNFKRNNLATRDKKAEIRRFIDNIQKR